MITTTLNQNVLLKGKLRQARLSGLFLGLCVLLVAQRSPAPVLTFPLQGDDTTPSMGVFRIVVDPLFRPLLSPTGRRPPSADTLVSTARTGG